MKKVYIVIILSLLISSVSFSQEIDYPKIVIKKEQIKFNKEEVSKGWTAAQFTFALGSADRQQTGFNNTETYDNFGIVLFESVENSKPTGYVSEVQIHFIPEVNKIAPLKGYGEKVKVDKLLVDKNLSKDVMLKKLKNWKKTESYIEHSYRMQCGRTYIYFQFTDDELSLKKMSIGKSAE